MENRLHYFMKRKIFHCDIFTAEGFNFILTWFFILMKSKNQSKPKHFNFISIIFNSRLCSCFLFGSTRKKLEKMLLQRNPNWTFFTGFLSSYWPEQYLYHTAFPITALLRLLAKCRKWEERWCTDRIQTVKRSEQGFGSGIAEGRRDHRKHDAKPDKVSGRFSIDFSGGWIWTKLTERCEKWTMGHEEGKDREWCGAGENTICSTCCSSRKVSILFWLPTQSQHPPLTLWIETLNTLGRHRILQLMLTVRLLKLGKLFIYNTVPFSRAPTIKYVT